MIDFGPVHPAYEERRRDRLLSVRERGVNYADQMQQDKRILQENDSHKKFHKKLRVGIIAVSLLADACIIGKTVHEVRKIMAEKSVINNPSEYPKDENGHSKM